MGPRLVRMVALACAVLALLLTALDVAAEVVAPSRLPFATTARADGRTTVFTVTAVRDRTGVDGPIAVGDEVRLANPSFLEEMRLMRLRFGERFAYEGRHVDGRPVRFTATAVAAPQIDPLVWTTALQRVALALVALIVALRAFAQRAARTLVWFFLVLALEMQGYNSWFSLSLCAALFVILLPLSVGTGFLLLAVATEFPERSAVGPRRFLARANIPVTAAALLSALAFAAVSVLNVAVSPGTLAAWQGFTILVNVFYYGGAALAFVCAVREARGAERRRALWVAYSTLLGIVGPIITIVLILAHVPLGHWFEYFSLTLLAIPFGLGYAIVRHRVVDIGFVVNRALVFGTVTAIVIGAFAALDWTLSKLFTNVSHLTSNLSELALTVALAFSMRPLHDRVDGIVDDLFFRRRHEALAALRQFAREVAFITDPRIAVARAHGELCVRLDAAACAIFVRAADAFVRVDPAALPDAALRVDLDDPALVRLRATREPVSLRDLDSRLRGDRVFPMCVRDEIVGAVVLGAKANGEAYDPDERACADSVVLALGNALDALQTEALRREVARVVLDGAPLDDLRRTVDVARWFGGRQAAQPAGLLAGRGE